VVTSTSSQTQPSASESTVESPYCATRPVVFSYSLLIIVAALAMVGTLPGRTHGLGLITEGLLQSLQMERTVFARINLFATLIGAFACWPCGWLLDRIGMRLTGAMVLLLLGISTLGVATATSAAALAVWITLTRAFGQSMLSVVSITLSGKASLNLRQATAMAAYSFLVSILFIVAFKLMGAAIHTFGWRNTWTGLGWIVLASAPVFAILVFELRNDVTRGEHSDPSTSATTSQALRSAAFWVFALSSSFYGFVSSGLGLFNQSILNERHFDATVYYDLLAVSTFAGLVGNMAAGWFARRVSYANLMGLAMTVYMLALLAFPFVTSIRQVYCYGVAMGACGGIVTVVFFGVWSHAYGRQHLGRIQGIAQAATVLASAAGPVAFAECDRFFGSYVPAFLILAPCVGCLAIAAWIIPTPSAAAGQWTFSSDQMSGTALAAGFLDESRNCKTCG
jgi:MFS family permease